MSWNQHAHTSSGQSGQLGIIKLVNHNLQVGAAHAFANKAKDRLSEYVSSGTAFLDGRDRLKAANSEPEKSNGGPHLSSRTLPAS